MDFIPTWHPLVVHFPLALIVVATLSLSAARLVKSSQSAASLALVGTFNLCAGAIGVFLALATGLAAAGRLQIGIAAHQAVSAHVKSAEVTALLTVAVGVWRTFGVDASARPSGTFLLLLWLATASLTVTGYRGSLNVYRYGVGVEARAASAPVELRGAP